MNEIEQIDQDIQRLRDEIKKLKADKAAKRPQLMLDLKKALSDGAVRGGREVMDLCVRQLPAERMKAAKALLDVLFPASSELKQQPASPEQQVPI